MPESRALDDVNAIIAGLLGDLAAAQLSKQKAFGYKRAAAVVSSLEESLETLRRPDGTLPKLSGIGPATTRVILEVLDTGGSSSVERTLSASPNARDIERRRASRSHALSRAAVVRTLAVAAPGVVDVADYRGDLQMHSEWSDGAVTLGEIIEGCLARGYEYAAVTDHSHGLAIAGGMTPDEVARQHALIDALNVDYRGRFRLLKGVEANIGADGALDLSDAECAQFEIVLAAPHSLLRREEDQTARMLRALDTPGVAILAHPRGRVAGSRAGVRADWEAVFRRAAALGVAVEIDGDPSRQDLDYPLARRAFDAGCLFAIDSDAHAIPQLQFVHTGIAHARLAGIPPARIVNCWPLERLMAWAAGRQTGAPRRVPPRRPSAKQGPPPADKGHRRTTARRPRAKA